MSMHIAAAVFDAYGTLFDVHSAVGKNKERLGDIAERVSLLWRTKQLEYTWLRSLMHRHADFWQVTGEALDYALDSFGIADAELRRNLMDSYLRLSCYPEIPETLQALKKRSIKTAVLSNGSPRMLTAAVESCQLGNLLDAVLSVEAVGVYKPDPRVYQLAVDRLNVPAEKIIFVTANAWDAAGAKCFGMMVAWINRFGQRPERLPCEADAEIASLDGLPALLDILL